MKSASRTHATIPPDRPDGLLAEILHLYEAGRYLDCHDRAQSLGDIRRWPGPEGQVMAGRLANNLGAPRLGRAIHWRAYRQWPDHPYCLYYGCMAYWSRLGTFHAWSRFRETPMPEGADARCQADWAACKALMLCAFRDFSRAEQLMNQALELDPESPWLQVELGELLDRQDRHEESLEVVQRALEQRPWFRPAVQSASYKLVQLRRDKEARELLTQATGQLQSGEVWCQLALLQQELKQYDAAWQSIVEAEKHWPLASADSVHRQWLDAQRSDLAYYRGDYQLSLEFARRVDRPFYKRLVERLEQPSVEHPRIQLPVPFIRQHHDTCAPATLTALAQYWNHCVEHEQVVQRICYEGTASSDERRWAEENGFIAHEFRVTETVAEHLIRAGIPFTLNTVDPGSAHLQAVVGIDVQRGTFLIQDPSERLVSEAAIDKLLEHYSSTGPRGMVMLPQAEASRLDAFELPDAELYDLHYQVDRGLAEHRRDDAWQAVERLVGRAPEHRLTLQSQMALTRYDSNTPEMQRLTEKLLEQFPQDANLQLIRLSCLTELGTRNQRLEALREACDAKETHPIFWTRLAAELLDDARDHEEARWRLRRVLRAHQGDGRALAIWSNLQWDRGCRQQALEGYRLAAAVSDKDESFSRSYFSAARCLGQTQSALEWLSDRHRRFGSRSTQPARTLASALDMLERTGEALEILERAAAEHAEDGQMHCFLALTLNRYNLREAGERHLQQALGKCPETTYIRACASVALYQGRISDAREQFLKVLEREPLDMQTLEQVAQLDRDLEGDEVAEQRLREAVARFPHSYSMQVSLIQWLRNHRPLAAQPEMDKFLQRYPESAWGHREAAILALISRNLESARRHARAAIDLEPNNDTAHYLLGRVALDEGRMTEARQYLRITIEKNCDHESAIAALLQTCDRPSERREQLGFVLEQLRLQTTFGDGVLAFRQAAVGRLEPDAILAGLEEALRFRPDLWHCWAAVTHQLMAMNLRARAVEVATQATERFPMTPRVWLDLALVHRAVGDEAAELAALQRARQINPNWVDVARELADFHLKREQYEQAEEVLRGVLAADPRDPVALACLAECLYRAGRRGEALEPMQQACLQAPGYTWAWQMLIQWSGELDAGLSARSTAGQVIDQRPHDSRGYLHYAEACHEIDYIPQGLEMLDRALKLDARDLDCHLLKAQYLGQLHRWDEALEACQPAVFGQEQPVALRMRRAYVLYRKGQLGDAIQALRSALVEDPDHFQGWSQLAGWAEELGEPQLYREASENLMRIDPHQPVPYGYLAEALIQEGQAQNQLESRQLAKQYLRKAIDLSPEYAFATARLTELCLDDGELDQAQAALDLGGPHLPSDQLRSLQLRLAAARSESTLETAPVLEQLLDWCRVELGDKSSAVRAVDKFSDDLARQALDRLTDEVKRHPASADLGVPLGRLIARLSDAGSAAKRLSQLPDGPAWDQAVYYYLRSLSHFQRPAQAVLRLLKRCRQRLRPSQPGWSAVASTLLDFGRNSDVVKWTRDWRQRDGVELTNLIAMIAAHWELFRRPAARNILEEALRRIRESPEIEFADLVRVWAGLDRLLDGAVDEALGYARHITPQNLAGWYQLGYRMLIVGLEATPPMSPVADSGAPTGGRVASGRRAVAELSPSQFPMDAHYRNDRLTRWLLIQIQVSLAKRHGLRIRRWVYWLKGWWTRLN